MRQKTRLSLSGTAIAFAVLILITVTSTPAQTPEIWGELAPGPYAVGFATIEKFDYSRTFRPEKDYFGNVLEGESARPIQVCYWYPAQADENRTPMIYGEYAFPYPNDARFFDLLGTLQNQELGVLFFMSGNDQGPVLTSMNLELYATRDATPAEGPFPLVVYHGGRRGAYSQNAVMCEYLASHGFVVATTHTIGTGNAAVFDTGADFESVVRDKEMISELVRELPFVDASQTGLLGFGFGGATALIHRMRQTGIDAVVTIQGSFLTAAGGEAVRQNPFYNRQAMRSPWLQMHTVDTLQAIDRDLIDSLVYCRKYEVSVNGFRPEDLSTYRLITALTMPDSTRSFEQRASGHRLVCQYVLNFFDGYLKGNDAGAAWLESGAEPQGFEANAATLAVATAETVPPDQVQFVDIIQSYGIDRALEVADQFDLTNPEHPIVPDARFTQLGYQFLQRGRTEDAIKVFRMGVTAYPTSANAWDSYGEACAANGQIELALANYRKALETLPLDSTLTQNFRTILETGVPAAIERLEQQLSGTTGSEN